MADIQKGIALNPKSILQRVDTTPTADSESLITSGGVKEYVDTQDASINARIDTVNTQLGQAFYFKGSCAKADLPASGNTVNDTYYVTDAAEQCWYSWDGTKWVKSSMSQADYAGLIAQLKADISSEFSTAKTYDIGDYCLYGADGKLYVCTTAITTTGAVWDATKWQEFNFADAMSDIVMVDDTQPTSIANKIWVDTSTPDTVEVLTVEDASEIVAPEFDSTQAYEVGDYVMYNAKLYKANTATAANDGWIAARWTQVTVIGTINDQIGELKAHVEDGLYISNNFSWENGNISATGVNNNTNRQYRVRTVGFIQDNSIEMLACPSDTMFVIHMYSGQSASNWVGVFNGTSFAETGGEWIGEFDFGRWQATYPTYYFRFVMQKRTFTEIGPSYGKYLYVSGYDSIDLKITNGISNDFNQFGTYSVGDYCYYHTVLYRFIDDKPAGAWDDTKVNPVSIITDIQIAAVNVDKKAVYDKFCTHFNTNGTVSSYIFFTDPHIYNKNCSDSLIKKMFSVIQNAYNSTPTDFVMCGGDWLVGRKNDIIPDGPTPAQACGQLGFLAGVTDKLFKPYYPIIGNHDTNYKNTTLSQQTINNLMFRGQGESYYRFEAKDVAYYVFDSGLDNNTDTITQRRAEQLDWFATALLTETKPNVVICTHIFYATTTGVWNRATVSKMGEYMAAIAAAYNVRQNYSAGWDNTKSYDYSGKTGKVDYIIAGHLHHDWIVQESGIPVVMTTWVLNNYTYPTFDLMAHDHDSNIVYCDRVGEGANRIMHCNQEAVTTTKTLTATITGTLTWTSDSTDVATVSDGTVTAVASGYSLITAANENGEIETWVVSVS